MASFMSVQDCSYGRFGVNNCASDIDTDLTVCGYACKYYRDDDKALEIDNGIHLVPCPWNTSLLMSRFDIRGLLSDLRPYDMEQPDIAAIAHLPLSPKTTNEEQHFDLDRYEDLDSAAAQQKLMEEEEYRRTAAHQLGYSAVGFSYNDTFNENVQRNSVSYSQQQPRSLGGAGSRPATSQSYQSSDNINTMAPGNSVPVSDEENLPYHVAEELAVPSSMTVPSTLKQGRIIEKTAQFVAKQGSQMEIVLKTKQANNPSFQFLSIDDSLNSFYKHMVYMVRCGMFLPREPPRAVQAAPPVTAEKSTENNNGEQRTRHSSGDYIEKYLETCNVSKVNLADTAYGRILSRIRGLQGHTTDSDGSGNVSPVSTVTEEPQNVVGAAEILPVQQLLDDSTKIKPPINDLDQYKLQMEKFHREYYAYQYPKQRVQLPSLPSDLVETSKSPNVNIMVGQERQIVDKMAEYVARNGAEFESVVRDKCDPRFAFLDAGHPHHAYYLDKRRGFELQLATAKAKELLAAKGLLQKATPTPSSASCVSAAVSFHVKPDQRRRKSGTEESSSLTKNKRRRKRSKDSRSSDSAESENDFILHPAVVSSTTTTSAVVDVAEKRLRDRLAVAARDKLAQVNRADQLQLERKKRAAAFLAKLKDDGSGVTSAFDVDQKQLSSMSNIQPLSVYPPPSNSTAKFDVPQQTQTTVKKVVEMKPRSPSPSEILYRPLRRQRTPPAAYAVAEITSSDVHNRRLRSPSPNRRMETGILSQRRDRDRERDRERHRRHHHGVNDSSRHRNRR